MKMKYVFIENPIAGGLNKSELFERIKSAFRWNEHEMIIEHTHKKGDATQIAREYAEKFKSDAVIVSCGGDGTVHEIANGLAGSETPLMVLPLGTGNDFAKKIYNTKKINVSNVIKSFGLVDGNVRYDIMPIDLIDYNGEICINVLSAGVDTYVETIGRKIAGKIPSLGSNAYNFAVVPAVATHLKNKINARFNCVDDDGHEYILEKAPMDYCLMAICNASYYGGGYCPAKDSKLDDGILDLVFVEYQPLPKIVPIIPSYSKGVAHEKFPDIVKKLKITGGRIWMDDSSSIPGNADGENFDYNDVEFKVLPKSLKLCVIKN